MLPQSPLDWVLLAVGTATAIIIAVAMQDFFVVGEAFRNYKFGTGYLVPPVSRLVGRSLN